MPVHSGTLRVAFRRFYPGFNPNSFWIPLLTYAIGKQVQVVRPKRADLVVSSVFEAFGETWRRRLLTHSTPPQVPEMNIDAQQGARHIWVTGENIRPPICGYDLTVSFDRDPFGGTNVYFPLMFEFMSWKQYWNSPTWSAYSSPGVPRLDAMSLSQPRTLSLNKRKKFLCAFIGNPEPTRLRAIKSLRRYGEVEVFGSAVGRPVKSKAEIAKDYRFMLAFENDVYPGYVTEKVLEAYACGCIPLWWGDDAAKLLTPTAIVNARNFQTLDDFADQVADLDSDLEQLNDMASMPLLSAAPSLDDLTTALAETMDTRGK